MLRRLSLNFSRLQDFGHAAAVAVSAEEASRMAANPARIEEIRSQRALQGLPERIQSKEVIEMIKNVLIESKKRGAAA